MSRTRVGSTPKVKATIGPEVKSCLKLCLSYNLKVTEANLMKLHRKIKHNERVCCVQELGSYAQGQSHNRVKGQILS